MEISTKGKVSIPGDTARADEAFGPFPSPTRLPSLHQLHVRLQVGGIGHPGWRNKSCLARVYKMEGVVCDHHRRTRRAATVSQWSQSLPPASADYRDKSVHVSVACPLQLSIDLRSVLPHTFFNVPICKQTDRSRGWGRHSTCPRYISCCLSVPS